MSNKSLCKEQDIRSRPKHGSRALQEALEAVEIFGKTGLTIMPAQPDDNLLTAGARAEGISIISAERDDLAMVHAVFPETPSLH